MKAFLPLWQRELASYFRTPVGYVVGVFFLLVTGIGFWWQVHALALGAPDGQFTAVLFGSRGYWLAMFIATPLLTMRLFAEERRLQSIETLLTAPVTETEVVLSKFAGAYVMFLLLWLPTVSYGFWLRECGASFAPLDVGAIAASYLGTALIGASFISLGTLCSLLTRHQIVAAMGCLALLGLLLLAGAMPLQAHSEAVRALAPLFSVPLHMQDFASGIVDTRAVVWHLGAAVLLLFSAIRILEARRLR